MKTVRFAPAFDFSAAAFPGPLGPYRWLYLDLNSYFASVEQQENPHLRGKPVIVSPAPTEFTVAIAASYEAKRLGVKTGTPIREARRLIPGLHVVPARHDYYVRYHHRIAKALDKHLPIEAACSIDEFACRLTGTQTHEAKARRIAAAIKAQIAHDVGPYVRASIGMGPNKFLAKVATNMQKPDGLILLRKEELPERLYDLGFGAIPGIGRAMTRRLEAAGITDMKGLLALAPKRARHIWGGVGGERLLAALYGVEVEEPKTVRRSVSHSHVLAKAMRAAPHARAISRRLTAKAASRLRRLDYRARCVGLYVRFAAGGRWRGDAGVQATQDSFLLLKTHDALWAQMSAERPAECARGLRQVSVWLTGLRPVNALAADLFADGGDPAFTHAQEREHLCRALDGLNSRYGRNAISIGAHKANVGEYTGVKIAFTRIPDAPEFDE
jgi:DNA polymerase IV